MFALTWQVRPCPTFADAWRSALGKLAVHTHTHTFVMGGILAGAHLEKASSIGSQASSGTLTKHSYFCFVDNA